MPDPTPGSAPATPPAAPVTPPASDPAAAAAGAPAGTPPAAPAVGAANPPAAAPPAAELKLTLPDKSPLTPARLEKIAAFAKERGLSAEDAQALVIREHEAASSVLEAQEADFNRTREGWKEASMKHPELGGDKLAKHLEVSKRVLTRFGNENFIKLLDSTGFGDHPDVLDFFVKVGKAAGEDVLVHPGAAAPGNTRKSNADVFSPTLSGEGQA